MSSILHNSLCVFVHNSCTHYSLQAEELLSSPPLFGAKKKAVTRIEYGIEYGIDYGIDYGIEYGIDYPLDYQIENAAQIEPEKRILRQTCCSYDDRHTGE
jgi:hypothetical protein